MLSAKVLDDGTQFWGGKKKKLRMMYVAQGEHSLQHELERLADFASIPLSCRSKPDRNPFFGVGLKPF